jgi:hypothetical protein
MEALSKMLSVTMDRGLLDGFTVGLRNATGMVVSIGYLQMIEWVFVGVCGPNDDGERSLWDD